MTDQCAECGAGTTERSCEELFHTVLALDHQRAQPWGALHGVVVACYLLQHPSVLSPHQRGAQVELVAAFCDGGLDGLHRLTAAARARNSHRAPTRTDRRPAGTGGTPSPPTRGAGTTIHDVAVDGTFPADGYEQRVEQWARDVRAAWTPEDR